MFASHETATPDEERFLRELEAATNLEEFDKVKKPEHFSRSGLSDEWCRHLERVMLKQVEAIKTPENIIDVQQYFEHHRTYSRTVQEALGEKAKVILSKWHP